MHLNLSLQRIVLASVICSQLLLGLFLGACKGQEYSDKNPSALRQYVTEPKDKAEDVKNKIEQQQKDVDEQLNEMDHTN